MDQEILSLEGAAELFGVSVKTFIKLLKEESVPGRKIGREWKFSKKALIDWLSAGDSKAYSDSEAETKEFFNEIASNWEQLRKDYYDEDIMRRLLDLNIVHENSTVVDLGAGDGFISRGVAKKARKVIAIDISQGMLNELVRKADKEGLMNIETLVTDGVEIPLEGISADVVCANMVLHHYEQPESAIKEIHRVLRPGGTIFLADLIEHSDNNLMEKMHDIWPGFNIEKIKLWLCNSGFKSVHIIELTKSGLKPKSNNKSKEKGIFIAFADKE